MQTPSYKKYAVIGSHGAGKSTFTLRLAYELRKRGHNVDTVQERVRYSPFPFNDKSTPETALWLYHVQICRELESISRGFDHIVCDRSAVDALIYAQYFNLHNMYLEKIIDSADEWMMTYDKVFFIRPDIDLVLDGVRSDDEAFRIGVDQLFEDYVHDHCAKFYEIKTSHLVKGIFKDEWIA